CFRNIAAARNEWWLFLWLICSSSTRGFKPLAIDNYTSYPKLTFKYLSASSTGTPFRFARSSTWSF
ncbi:MAG: hypothetical protein AB8B69_13920, partial [Chitinophagales bacterium]